MNAPMKMTQAELATERYDRILATIPCAVYDYVRWPDGSNHFTFISTQCVDIFEYEAEEVMSNPGILWSLVHADDVERLREEDRRANLSGKRFQSEIRIVVPSGRMKWIELTSMASGQTYEGQILWSGVIHDITERKLIEEEKNRLLVQLKHALAEIKTLEGILSVCSFCKKIRDEKGDWQEMETYIAERSKVDFSHGLCPVCVKKHYPEYNAP